MAKRRNTLLQEKIVGSSYRYRYFKTAIYVRHPRQNPPIFLPFCAMFLITKISLLGYYFLGFCSAIMDGFCAAMKTIPDKAPVHK